ncbi:hypothetical protein HEP87_07945 [Streptomyces sp. S1D4-11]|nr:hypothetical protein [Streptomyces sp. S1D4-11]QIY94000.1 hypothetical protein HEP87_07945 [Streptomyces sp. S1D4-11]
MVLTVSTALAAGGATLPASAFAAPTTPHTAAATTMAAEQAPGPGVTTPTANWVEITDPPTGVKAQLPGKAKVQEGSKRVDGKVVHSRMYTVEVGDGFIGETVRDMDGVHQSLKDDLQGFLNVWNSEPGVTIKLASTNSQKATVDGHPALCARITSKGGGSSGAGATCFVADGTHLIQTLALGPASDEKAMQQMHQQFLASIRIP